MYRSLSFKSVQNALPINCPGDVLQYNCSIQSNSENFTLGIAVIPHNGIKMSHFFQNLTLLNVEQNLLSNPRVNVTLRALNVSSQYAEAIIEVIIESDAPINGSELECIFDNQKISLIVNTNDPLGNFKSTV